MQECEHVAYAVPFEMIEEKNWRGCGRCHLHGISEDGVCSVCHATGHSPTVYPMNILVKEDGTVGLICPECTLQRVVEAVERKHNGL